MRKFQPIIHKYVNLNQISPFNFRDLHKNSAIIFLNICKKQIKRLPTQNAPRVFRAREHIDVPIIYFQNFVVFPAYGGEDNKKKKQKTFNWRSNIKEKSFSLLGNRDNGTCCQNSGRCCQSDTGRFLVAVRGLFGVLFDV